ncbi:hypothetical protein Y032_0091g2453 [Ancylostoma ceylanicum]|uniref:Uncharacterized protein n=1 Tax=Ancylostoma ceylanicum TaxID=53326 RepID=A0A016TLG4_9BILA|nr:hypothetical protein Y032_0091g2453 [Ancylostoma ceylanicum]
MRSGLTRYNHLPKKKQVKDNPRKSMSSAECGESALRLDDNSRSVTSCRWGNLGTPTPNTQWVSRHCEAEHFPAQKSCWILASISPLYSLKTKCVLAVASAHLETSTTLCNCETVTILVVALRIVDNFTGENFLISPQHIFLRRTSKSWNIFLHFPPLIHQLTLPSQPVDSCTVPIPS